MICVLDTLLFDKYTREMVYSFSKLAQIQVGWYILLWIEFPLRERKRKNDWRKV